jgi:hypothetical protein
MIIFSHCAAAERFHTDEFWQRPMGWVILVRAALMACAVGAFVLTLTKAEAQAPLDSNAVIAKYKQALEYSDQFLDLSWEKCLDKVTIDLSIQRAKDLIAELLKVKYEPALPKNYGDSPHATPPETAQTIDDKIAALERLIKLLPTKICPPEPVKPAAPPPPVTPVTPPKVTPVPVTPPVAETPKHVAKTCPICRSIADQIADVDEQIASWERQDVSLHKANVNDPGIQTALKDIANRLAQLKSRRVTLEAQKTECEKKCVSTTEEKKTGEKTEHGSSTREKPNEHKTTDKKKGRKKKDDTAHETGVGLPTGISIGIGIGGGRREERGNDRKLRSNEGGRQDGGGGFGTGGGGVFGR